MIQTLSISKLTPPQITAIREALPACVEAGVLTTTRSIATLTLPEDYHGPVVLDPNALAEVLQPRPVVQFGMQVAAPSPVMQRIVAKLTDPEQAHVRTSTLHPADA